MGYKALRRIGVGDRERVRAGLIQILCASHENLPQQVEECLLAAQKLDKQLRVYMNADLLDPSEIDYLVNVTMGRARNHDIMMEQNIDEKHFEWILGRCDIILLPDNNDTPIHQSIIDAWGVGRELGAYELSDEQRRQKFAHLYGQEDIIWKILKAV